MYHIADYNTGEDYRVFNSKLDVFKWIRRNCEVYDGKLYYMGNRIEVL